MRSKLQEAFDKGKADNERFLREQETDTAAMAEEAESSMIEVRCRQASARFAVWSLCPLDPLLRS